VCAEVSKGVAHISMDVQKPVMFGVLTCNTTEEAIARAGTKAGNKGFDVAMGAIEMMDLIENLK
jgi:6,7-dimethyl-8-ribityllumazine synthase